MSQGVITPALDSVLAYVRDNCTRIVAVITYVPGTSYAAALAGGNVVASAPLVAADFAITDGPAGARVLNNALKTDAAADAAGDPSHFLFIDDTGQRVLRWTSENTTGSVSVGGQVTLPNVPLTVRQPVAA